MRSWVPYWKEGVIKSMQGGDTRGVGWYCKKRGSVADQGPSWVAVESIGTDLGELLRSSGPRIFSPNFPGPENYESLVKNMEVQIPPLEILFWHLRSGVQKSILLQRSPQVILTARHMQKIVISQAVSFYWWIHLWPMEGSCPSSQSLSEC